MPQDAANNIPASLASYLGQQSTVVSLTGNALLDVLLSGSKWGTGAAGSGASVTYAFPASTSLFDSSEAFGAYGDANFSGYIASQDFAGFGAAEQASARAALQAWANVAHIAFTEVQASGTAEGTLRFAYSGAPGMQPTGFGVSLFPMDAQAAGDTWINARFIYPDGWSTGTQNRLTLLHEIGHALGLKHPHDTGFSGVIDGWPATTNVLPFTDSDTLTGHSTENSVMAYNDVPGIGAPFQADYAPTTPMAMDIAAIQYLYGANTSFNAGNTPYRYASDQRVNETIWDGGGTDTIEVSGSGPAVISLVPGTWSQVGAPLTYSEHGSDLSVTSARPDLTNPNTLYIYDTVTIENAAGGAGADSITGNAAANVLRGNGGNDTLDGGAGSDTAAYAGARANFTVARTASGYTVADQTGAEGTDSLAGIERLQFSDRKLALDLDGAAGNAAKVLGAAYGKAYLTPEFVGTAIGLFDNGMTMQQVCQLAIHTDLFLQLAGSHGNVDFVNLVYRNVVGSAPSDADRDYYVGLLQGGGGMSQADLLAAAANCVPNQTNIDLVGLQQSGIEYA